MSECGINNELTSAQHRLQPVVLFPSPSTDNIEMTGSVTVDQVARCLWSAVMCLGRNERQQFFRTNSIRLPLAETYGGNGDKENKSLQNCSFFFETTQTEQENSVGVLLRVDVLIVVSQSVFNY